MGLFLLTVAFNAIMFVGPFCTMVYDIFRWWIFHKNTSGKTYCSNICCSTVCDTHVNSEYEIETPLNNMEHLEKGIKTVNNPSDNISPNNGGIWTGRQAPNLPNNVNDIDIVDDYIMKSPSLSLNSEMCVRLQLFL